MNHTKKSVKQKFDVLLADQMLYFSQCFDKVRVISNVGLDSLGKWSKHNLRTSKIGGC